MDDMTNLNRRALLQHLAVLLGTAALPTEAVFAATRKGGKRFFRKADFTLLTAIADTLVPQTDTPGAVKAGVPVLVDGLLANWASANTRALLAGALAGVNKRALDADKTGFAGLTPARRKELLIAHEQEALKQVPRKVKLTGLAAMLGGPSYADPGYGKLKDMLVSLYYVTEIGMTQELVYEHVPGKWVPSFKITPQTRPFATVGPF